MASPEDDGIEILDISDPSNPTHAGAITDDDTTVLAGAYSIQVSGKYAYVAACFDDGVEVLDISDPSNPTHAGAIEDDETTELDGARTIFVSGKFALVASELDDGVEILDITGLMAPCATIGAIASDSLDVSGTARIGNNLSVCGGVNVGTGGIKSKGSLSVEANAYFGGGVRGDGPITINDMLRLPHRESPPDAPENGCIYYDQTDQDAFCVYVNGVWEKIVGSGSCQ